VIILHRASDSQLRMSQASKMALLMALSLPKEAFDTIDHSLHIRKVHRYGVDTSTLKSAQMV